MSTKKKLIPKSTSQTTLSKYFSSPAVSSTAISSPGSKLSSVTKDQKRAAVSDDVVNLDSDSEHVPVTTSAKKRIKVDSDTDDMDVSAVIAKPSMGETMASPPPPLASKRKAAEPRVFESDPATHEKFVRKLKVSSRDPVLAKVSTEKVKYTPFEQQYIELRQRYPDVVLLIECGYKFRFMGEDAELAAKILSIFCYRDHNFVTASIPVPRLPIHVKRLVEAGHKVGVVRQTETAALKAVSTSKSTPFTRKLTALYTKSTLVMDDIDVPASEEPSQLTSSQGASGVSTFLMCLFEEEASDRGATICIVACDTLSGQVVWDRFEDKSLRSALETRLAHLQPSELLLPTKLSFATDKLIRLQSAGVDAYRVEKRPLSDFDSEKTQTALQEYYDSAQSAETSRSVIIDMPSGVQRCLGVLLSYLKEFQLDKVLRTAVEELANSPSSTMEPLLVLMHQTPDLERGLCRILHRKASPVEFFSLMKAFTRICKKLPAASEFQSDLLRRLFRDMVDVSPDAEEFLAVLDESCADGADKTDLFTDLTEYPDIAKYKQLVADDLAKLDEHLVQVRRIVQKPKLEYTSVNGAEFLVEVTQVRAKDVPKDWVRASAYVIACRRFPHYRSTKELVRFTTPFVAQHYALLQQHRELLIQASNTAWLQFLTSVCERYVKFHAIARGIATLDCLLSLAAVARLPGYCKPEIVTEQTLEIEGGRHPVVEALGNDTYVPNDTKLTSDGMRCMVITGPNMGGKSCYIRQVVVMAILAQIGSFIPAVSARMSVFDAIYTRMGASDDLAKGRSTFFVELQETSEILSKATDRSLVVLDELGRGTSTHDGTAIAWASLQHLVTEVKCFVMFVTHYPLLAELSSEYPQEMGNFYMSYLVNKDEDASSSITFLFKLVAGVVESSFGLNVARMAHIPESVLESAAIASKSVEKHSPVDVLRRLAACVREKRVEDAVSLLSNLHKST